jgi:catechol 2,3-dioxygenase-like lactoylglutathione lyase family enzyme
MQINRIDHLVITVADIERTVDFYQRVLGMQRIEFAGGRVALRCGAQKINLHQLGNEFEPKALQVKAGSADLCLVADTPINEAIAHIRLQGVNLIDGPVNRSGANGPIVSLYLRDPDGNLIEISNYLNDEDSA